MTTIASIQNIQKLSVPLSAVCSNYTGTKDTNKFSPMQKTNKLVLSSVQKIVRQCSTITKPNCFVFLGIISSSNIPAPSPGHDVFIITNNRVSNLPVSQCDSLQAWMDPIKPTGIIKLSLPRAVRIRLLAVDLDWPFAVDTHRPPTIVDNPFPVL